MEEFIFAVQQFERFPVVLSCLAALLVYTFLRSASGVLALFSVPVILAGCLGSHYLFTVNSIVVANDKDTNIASGVAIGMLVSFAILMIVYLLVMMLLERRSAAKKLKPLVGIQRT